MENFTPEGAAPLHASEKSLAHQVQGDVASAVLSALPAAAFVSIIDQAVTQNASKSATLLNSMKQSLKTMFTRPHRFFTGPAYLAVAGVYTFTYVAANLTMTWCERTDRKPDMYKLGATSAANITAGVTKDTMFAIWFGAPGMPKITPLDFPAASWALFLTRDVMTIYAGFVFPAKASQWVQDKGLIESPDLADVSMQMTVPSMFQFFLTPIHLTALDIYNRPNASLADRAWYVKNVLLESAAARCVRVLVVYGMAGTSNKYFRSRLRP